MANSAYRDFIPAGENVDGLGKGLTDFVPAQKPVTPTAATEPVAEGVIPTVPNQKKEKKGK